MAGKKVRNYLEARGFDGFYDLYHELSECVISRATSLGYIELAARGCKQNPAILADAGACNELDAYLGLSREVQGAIREFFWPGAHIPDLKLRQEFQMNRWQPFDETAWDAMLSQMASTIQSFISSLRELHGKILPHSVGSRLGEVSVTKLLDDVGKHLDDLSRWCIPEWVEYRLFVHTILNRIQSTCSMIYWILGWIRDFCDQNTAALSQDACTELNALTRLDETFYLSLGPFFWPGTSGDPDSEPVSSENCWYPYDQSAWDATLIQASVACGSFVQAARGHLENMTKDPIEELPDTEKIRAFFLSIGHKLDYISSLTNLLTANDQ